MVKNVTEEVMQAVEEKVEENEKRMIAVEEKKSYATYSDSELYMEALKRKLTPPIDETGRVIRAGVIQMLLDFDTKHRTMDDYPKFRVKFHKTGREGETNYVFIGLNDHNWQIPYDTEVILPEPALKVADNAVTTKYKLRGMSTGEAPGAQYEEVNIQQYPYTILGPA